MVGALLAVCFPAISETGSIRPIAEIRYFLTHIALVGAGFYFTFGCRYCPPARAILRSYIAVHLYALAITPLNLYLGTNYFFTLSAPKQLAFIHAYPHWLFLVVRLRHLSHRFRSDAPALRVAAAGRRSRVCWLMVVASP